MVRTDYPAHKAWPELGFSRTAEKPGRGRLGLPLAHWWRPIAEHNVFTFDRDTANLPAAALDTDVFRDCYEPRLKYPESSGLLAGWLADQVELVVTGQLSTELHEASVLRPDVRSAVEQFRRLAAPTERWESLAALVRAEVNGSF